MHEIRIDLTTLSFTAGLSLLAAIACGALPLWRGAQLATTLHGTGRANTASRTTHRVRHVLMGAQVALALVLLVGSGLMVRSLQKLRAMNPGFDASSALTFRLALPIRSYSSLAADVAAHRAILDRLAALPGVARASATSCLPLSGGCHGNSVRIEGRTIPPGTDAADRRLPRGRRRTTSKRSAPPCCAAAASAAATSIAPSRLLSSANRSRSGTFRVEDPIGRRVASNRPPPRLGQPQNLVWQTIVGIVADTPVRALAEPTPIPQLFMPMSLAIEPGSGAIGPDLVVMSYVVRTTPPPLSVVASVRQAIDGVDRTLALAGIRTLQDVLDGAAAQMAFTMVLLAIAAGVTLVLGAIGTYGVMSYIVSQRTGEIGVRLALGAEPGSVAGMIARQGGLVALAGAAVGLGVAFAGSRLIGSLLYDVSPRDPGVFAATTALLIAVALAACWLPARRASRLSPMEALRTE